MAIRATTNERLVRDAFRRLGDRQARAAIARATNRAGTSARSEASREIRKEVALKAATVRDAIKVSKASPSRPRVDLRISGRPIPLSRYPVRQTKAGVSVQVKRSSGRKVVSGAFIATMRSGHRGVFWRRLGASGKPVGRLPIRELFSTTVAQALDETGKVGRVLSTATRRFATELAREIRFRARKRAA